jgi:Putative glycolipid-binding
MDADPFTIWRGLDGLQVEAASVDFADDGMTAAGTQIGSDPVAYRLDYGLDARSGFVTRSLEISALGRGWRRELQLRHDGNGSWTCRASADGELALPAPGCDASVLAGALDCDLARYSLQAFPEICQLPCHPSHARGRWFETTRAHSLKRAWTFMTHPRDPRPGERDPERRVISGVG